MKVFPMLVTLLFLATVSLASAAETGIVPTGTLRAAYIVSNLAQDLGTFLTF